MKAGRRGFFAAAMATFALLLFSAEVSSAFPYWAPGQEPEFQFGFAFLKSQLGDLMGEPLECEHANPENGDTLQQTTTGLSFYRKSTNTPTFTDGWNHWAGPGKYWSTGPAQASTRPSAPTEARPRPYRRQRPASNPDCPLPYHLVVPKALTAAVFRVEDRAHDALPASTAATYRVVARAHDAPPASTVATFPAGDCMGTSVVN